MVMHHTRLLITLAQVFGGCSSSLNTNNVARKGPDIWVQIDLGQQRQITSVHLQTRSQAYNNDHQNIRGSAEGFNLKVAILASNDGINFIKLGINRRNKLTNLYTKPQTQNTFTRRFMITKTIKFEPPKDNMILFDQFYSNECMIDYDKYGKVGKIEISSKLNIITFNTVIKDKIPYDINRANSYIELDYCNEDFTKKYLTTPKSDKNGFSITTKVIKKLFGEEKTLD